MHQILGLFLNYLQYKIKIQYSSIHHLKLLLQPVLEVNVLVKFASKVFKAMAKFLIADSMVYQLTSKEYFKLVLNQELQSLEELHLHQIAADLQHRKRELSFDPELDRRQRAEQRQCFYRRYFQEYIEELLNCTLDLDIDFVLDFDFILNTDLVHAELDLVLVMLLEFDHMCFLQYTLQLPHCIMDLIIPVATNLFPQRTFYFILFRLLKLK